MEVSNKFKETIVKAGRMFDVIIKYNSNFKLTTEDNKLILTEDAINLITEQTCENCYSEQINGAQIWKLNKNNLGTLFKTYMKSFDLQTEHEFNVGEKMVIQVGVKEEQDAEYEYIDYGSYIVYEKKYNEETRTFTYTVCDDMLRTMVPFKQEHLDYMFKEWDEEEQEYVDVEETTLYNAMFRLLEYLKFNEGDPEDPHIILSNICNKNVKVYKKTFQELNITCRDLLDMMTQLTGCSLVIQSNAINHYEPYVVAIKINNTDYVLNEDILSNVNLSFNEKFGPINSLLFSRASGVDNIERKDDVSISTHGITQYAISTNVILDQENRADFIDELFNAIKGIEYYVCDFNCIGVAYIDYYDKFTVNARGHSYNCLCLKDTSHLEGGFDETFKSEVPIEKSKEYTNGGIDDKTAAILMDKLKGTLVLKVDKDGKVSQVRLDSSADEGSLVEIKGDQIKLEGTTTINERFKIDNNGYMNAKAGGEIAGWKITNSALYKDVRIGDYDYRVYIQSPLQNYTEDSWIFSTQKKHKNDSGYTGTSVIKLGGDISGKSITTNGHTVAWTSNVNGFYGAPSAGYMLISIDGHSGQYGIDIWASDKRLKRNIKKTNVKALDIINKIPHKEFIYNDDKEGKIIKIGYIADDLKDIDEQMIYEVGDEKMKHPNVRYIVPLLSKAIQEQQEQIEELQKEIEDLKGGNK